MTLNFNQEGKVYIRMEKYLEDLLKELPEDMNGHATSPAAAPV